MRRRRRRARRATTRDPLYVALWIGALVLAGDPSYDPLPPELDALASRYLTRFPPAARA